MPRLHRSQLLAELRARFPELAGELNAESGLLHLELPAFARFTQHAIDGGDTDTVRKAFEIAERYARLGNAKVQDAIGVSYVEHLELRDQQVKRRWAWALLPEPLRTEHETFHGKHHR